MNCKFDLFYDWVLLSNEKQFNKENKPTLKLFGEKSPFMSLRANIYRCLYWKHILCFVIKKEEKLKQQQQEEENQEKNEKNIKRNNRKINVW